MRDPLDGIHTRAGRVVYDRKKHKFTARDLQRIWKKINPELEKDLEDPEKNHLLLEILEEILEEIIQMLLTKKEQAEIAMILFSIAKLIDSVVHICDDKKTDRYPTGGGGASRDV